MVYIAIMIFVFLSIIHRQVFIRLSKNSVSATGSIVFLRCGVGAPTVWDPLERPNLSHWTVNSNQLSVYKYLKLRCISGG
jgi:hypothetical protein